MMTGATNTSNSVRLDFDHLHFSWESLGAIKAWVEVFFSLSPAEYAGLSFMHVAPLARCLMVLYRLSAYAHQDWDCNSVRNTVDLLQILDIVAEKSEVASREADEQESDDLFMRLAGMMRRFRVKAAARIGQQSPVFEVAQWSNDVEGLQSREGEGVAFQDQILLSSISQSDEAFLETMLAGSMGNWAV